MKRKRKDILRPRWCPLERSMITEEERRVTGMDEVYRNNVYQVGVRWFDSKEWGVPIRHLSIKRIDRKAVHDWRDLQRIKNEICDPECEAIEMYPAESRVVDTSNQYHLWVMPKGWRFPFGYEHRAVTEGSLSVFGHESQQRPFREDERPDDLIPAEQLAEAAAQQIKVMAKTPLSADDQG